MNFCHPRWPEERKYILQEIDEVNKSAISYFKDAWNYFDWITYACIFVVVVSRVLAVAWTSSKAAELHPKFMAVALIFIWLRLMKVLRLFQSLGLCLTVFYLSLGGTELQCSQKYRKHSETNTKIT